MYVCMHVSHTHTRAHTHTHHTHTHTHSITLSLTHTHMSPTLMETFSVGCPNAWTGAPARTLCRAGWSLFVFAGRPLRASRAGQSGAAQPASRRASARYTRPCCSPAHAQKYTATATAAVAPDQAWDASECVTGLSV